MNVLIKSIHTFFVNVFFLPPEYIVDEDDNDEKVLENDKDDYGDDDGKEDGKDVV